MSERTNTTGGRISIERKPVPRRPAQIQPSKISRRNPDSKVAVAATVRLPPAARARADARIVSAVTLVPIVQSHDTWGWLARRRSLPLWSLRLMERVFVAHFTADSPLARCRADRARVGAPPRPCRARVELRLWYTNDGLIPNHTLLWRPGLAHVFSLFYLASYRHEAVIGFVLCALSYGGLLIGFRTRIAQIRASSPSSACMDACCCSTTAVTWCWGCSAPGRRSCPPGPAVGRCRAGPALRWHRTPHHWPEGAIRRVRPGSPVRLARSGRGDLQLAFIYLFNAVHKRGPTWREGSAVHYIAPPRLAGHSARGLAADLCRPICPGP